VSILEEFLEVVNATKLYLGIPLDDWSEDPVNRIIELLRSQRDFLAGYYGASVYIPQLAKGDLHTAQAWSGDVIQAQSEESAVGYVLPKESTFIWIDFMVTPRNAMVVPLPVHFACVIHPYANSLNHLSAGDISATLKNVTFESCPSHLNSVGPQPLDLAQNLRHERLDVGPAHAPLA